MNYLPSPYVVLKHQHLQISQKIKKIILTTVVAMVATFTYAQKNVVEVITASKNHTTLLSALKSADLVTTLKGAGPYTVFAPTNDAFKKLSPGVLDNLMMKDNRDKLVRLLTCHVVAGSWSAKQIVTAINDGGGKAEIKTINGAVFYATLEGSKVKLTDTIGNVVWVTATDMKSNNGVVHVIDTVLMTN